MPLKAKSTWTDVPWCFCDKESYIYIYKCSLSIHATSIFYLIMSLHLLSFPKHSKTYLKP